MKNAFKLIGLCLAAVAISLIFAACGDDEENDGNTPTRQTMSTSGKNIKSMEIFDDESISFTYDAQGRVATETSHDGDDFYTTNFEYNDNNIIANTYCNGETYQRTVYTLTEGLITECAIYYNDSIYNCNEYYQYQNGYLTHCSDSSINFEQQHTWAEGNLTHVANSLDSPIDWFYSTTDSKDRVELLLIIERDYAMVLQGYYGHGTKKRIRQAQFSDYDGWFETDFNYTYDNNGDVSTISTMVEGEPITFSFVWE